jgi:hypothetical protein
MIGGHFGREKDAFIMIDYEAYRAGRPQGLYFCGNCRRGEVG